MYSENSIDVRITTVLWGKASVKKDSRRIFFKTGGHFESLRGAVQRENVLG